MRDTHFATFILLAAGPIFAQHAAKDAAPRPNVAEVRFADGSLVRMTILPDAIDVQTAYGKLTVPVARIRRIDFGLHVPPAVAAEIDDAVKKLGSENYKEREAAAKSLNHHGPAAYPSVKRAASSSDPETAARAADVIKRIEERHPFADLKTPEHDTVTTTDFTFTGRVLGTSPLKAHSRTFGDVELKLAELRTLRLGTDAAADIEVDAEKHGHNQHIWLDTGLVLNPGERLKVISEGKVDLWPQGPGQYMATPKGYTTAGRGGVHMAGALIGRIGDSGQPFVVGEAYEGVPGGDGKLWLQIVPNPWNGPSSGSYKVKVASFAR